MSSRRQTLGVCLMTACILLGAACIVTDPPSDLPRLPDTRPTIVRPAVVPQASSVLGIWPPLFIVPVELSNPRADFEYHPYIDFNANTGAGLQDIGVSRFEAANTSGRIRTVQIALPAPPDLDRCHTIEVIVAIRFAPNAHTPAEPGGDTVSWFYSPTGDLAGCPYATDIDAGPRDAAADSGDGGPQ